MHMYTTASRIVIMYWLDILSDGKITFLSRRNRKVSFMFLYIYNATSTFRCGMEWRILYGLRKYTNNICCLSLIRVLLMAYFLYWILLNEQNWLFNQSRLNILKYLTLYVCNLQSMFNTTIYSRKPILGFFDELCWIFS